MLGLFIKILPLAVASLNSPLMLGITVFLLASTDRPIKKTISFMLGIFSIMVGATFLGFWLGGDTSFAGKAILNSWEDLALGAILIILALRTFFQKQQGDSSKRLEKYQNQGLWKWFLFGLVMNLVNFNAVVPYILEIRQVDGSSIALIGKILLYAFSLIFFLLPFIFPFTVYLLFPNTAQKYIGPVSDWIIKYNRYIVSIIFAGFGIYLLFNGLT